MTTKQTQAVAAAILAALTAICAVLVSTDKPADGCQPCDCAGAIGLPGDATAAALPDAATK